MKVKVSGLLVLVLHMVVLAGFSLTQGCKTAKAGGAPVDQPVVFPADDVTGGGIFPAGKAPVVPPVSPMVPSAKTYSVQKGDTLSSIASAHGTTWKKLADYNNLSNPNQLKTGQELRIPDAGSVTSGTTAKHAVPVSSRPVAGSIKPGTYVVQKGDLLSTIAKRSGLTVAEIKTANNLTSDSLVAGKKLTIPKKGAAKAPAAGKAGSSKAASAKESKTAKKDAAVSAPLPAPAPLADATPAAASTGTVSSAAPVAVAAPGAAPVAKAASAPVYEHVLYPGETLDDVARQYGSSQQEIMKLNNITDPASIKPGTKLLVPIPE